MKKFSFIFNTTSFLQLIIFLSCIFIKIKTEILNPTIEFNVPYNETNSPAEPFTPLAVRNSNIYLIWLDSNYRPMVTQKKSNLEILTVPLDSNPDYTANPDGHHRYSIALDKQGYIHIAGDMHFYPSNPGNYLPLRYQNQTVMYWISNVPFDITKGFTFAGGSNASTAIPGISFTTGYFFNDKNNELYYTSMVRGVLNDAIRLTGELGVGLYKYDVNLKKWDAIGDYPPNYNYPDGTKFFKVFYWEYAGYGQPNGWFNNYWPMFQFDNQNTLHFVLSVGTHGAVSPNRVIYAKSYNNGNTWYKANGNIIPGFPLRVADSQSNQADIVYDAGTNGISVDQGIVADKNGNPIVCVNINWDVIPVWYHFNGMSWTNDISNPLQFAGYKGLLSENGIITLNAYNKIMRIDSLTSKNSAYLLNSYLPESKLSRFICLIKDDVNPNNIYGIGLSTQLKNISVIKLNFNSKPLPSNWANLDIGNDITLGGSADYDKGTFKIRSSGLGNYISNDSIHFAYTELNGDGTIIARIVNQEPIPFISGSTTGLMMRQSLDRSSKSAFIGISVNKEAKFIYRNEVNMTPNLKISYIQSTPYWIKLIRKDNVFSGFISQDAINWVQVGESQTIEMNKNIYIGLASFSSHLTEIFTSSLDNVLINSSNASIAYKV